MPLTIKLQNVSQDSWDKKREYYRKKNYRKKKRKSKENTKKLFKYTNRNQNFIFNLVFFKNKRKKTMLFLKNDEI